eukprot:7523992-Pyramimonas_sp.AAC.1
MSVPPSVGLLRSTTKTNQSGPKAKSPSHLVRMSATPWVCRRLGEDGRDGGATAAAAGPK